MQIEISLEALMKVYRLASLGKLMGGLIHNLNGPLQNVGIDMEMMAYTLQQKGQSSSMPEKNFVTRLKRMESEFDAINQLIRSISAKACQDDEDPVYRNLYDFLEHEFHFLNANLYFKHNIQKELRLQTDLPSITRLPERVPQALSWFIQGFVEELEREKIQGLILEGNVKDSAIRLDFIIQDGRLSDSFLEILQLPFSSFPSPPIDEKDDVGMALAMNLLKRAGVTLESEVGDPVTRIRVILPLLNEEG